MTIEAIRAGYSMSNILIVDVTLSIEYRGIDHELLLVSIEITAIALQKRPSICTYICRTEVREPRSIRLPFRDQTPSSAPRTRALPIPTPPPRMPSLRVRSSIDDLRKALELISSMAAPPLSRSP